MKSKIIEEDLENIISEFENSLLKLSGKNIFITGGNGLIGSYIIDTIANFNEKLADSCKFTILNKNEINKTSRLSHLIDNKNINFVTQDIGKPFSIIGNPDIIIHAASRANVTSFLQDPIDTIDANVNGTRTLLEYAKKNSVEQFLFFSSAEIYGNPIKEFIPTPETYTGNTDPLGLHACYTESKRFGETLCSTFFRKFNVPIKILRPLLVYGPGMKNDGKVISDFFEMAKINKQIKIRDKGEDKRSFCYISDATRAIFTILFNGKNGEAYNVGNSSENLTILELANLIAKLSDNDVKVEYNLNAETKKGYGERNRLVDISKINALGFKPKFSLEDGLKRLNEHYKEVGF